MKRNYMLAYNYTKYQRKTFCLFSEINPFKLISDDLIGRQRWQPSSNSNNDFNAQ